MRFHYLLYPEALERIKSSGIEDRVKKLKESEEGLPYLGGHSFDREIINTVENLKKDGFYEHLPQDFSEKYKSTMNGILKNPEDYFWTIKRPDRIIDEPCDLDDLLLFSGDFASMVLKPEEIWDYSKFGFSSPTELVAITGAFIRQESGVGTSFKEGYKWTKKRDDGSEIINEITGDHNADLRIYQTDIAPYPTIDPFGNEIKIRPETDFDGKGVYAYHSTEGSLLVAVMKYMEQIGIQSEYQSDEGRQLIKWGRSLGQGGGSCAEHFGGFDDSPSMFFIGYDFPMPQLNEKNETNMPSLFGVVRDGENSYNAYITHNNDFILSAQDKDNIDKPAKPISVRFSPDEAGHLVKGLIYQSAKGLGRTSANQLLEIIEYRHSPRFEVDREAYKSIF